MTITIDVWKVNGSFSGYAIRAGEKTTRFRAYPMLWLSLGVRSLVSDMAVTNNGAGYFEPLSERAFSRLPGARAL